MMNVILTIVTAFVLTLVLGRFLIPALRALKAGQAIREDGPTWHNSKAGTPTMGGLMFMAAAAVCVVIFGFAGVEITPEGIIQLPTRLPSHWKSLTVTGVGVDRLTFKVENPDYKATK